MILTYEKLWKNNPFIFRIPYEKYPEFLEKKYPNKVELVEIKNGKIRSIKETILTLLEDLEDNEWIYWCMDDRYIISLRDRDANDIYQTILEIDDPMICSIRLMRFRRGFKSNYIKQGGEIYTKRGLELLEVIYTDSNHLNNPWEHQFVRVKLLRNLFKAFPDDSFKAKEMDSFPHLKGYGEKCYIPVKNLVVFGESTSRGELTENCVANFKRWGLEIPTEFPISKKYHVSGKLPYNILGLEVMLPQKIDAKLNELMRWYWRNY